MLNRDSGVAHCSERVPHSQCVTCLARHQELHSTIHRMPQALSSQRITSACNWKQSTSITRVTLKGTNRDIQEIINQVAARETIPQRIKITQQTLV